VNDVTHILNAIEAGDPKAPEQLVPLVYNELRALAARRMAREPPGQTLQATALVHEAYLRLLGNGGAHWQNRRHFFGAAAEAMRRILIENARRKRSEKHGGALERVDWADVNLATSADDDQLLAIHESLQRLEEEDSTCAELVKLRFFVGMTGQEAAQALGIAERSATRLWAYARARLLQNLTR
jgi:RNA polymerase sigma factor (TIGR02999 family)